MAATISISIIGKNQTSGPVREVTQDLRTLGSTAESTGSRVGGFFRDSFAFATGGLIQSGIQSITSKIWGAATEGLRFNSSMEMVTAQLNAFTKDGAKTAEILEMIKSRAAQTPFEFEAMAKATTALLPASKASGKGLEDLIGLAEILAASNPAEGLEGAAFSLKEALSGDFTSIIERFNLPRQRLNQLKEQGVPALEAVQTAMKELGLDADLVGNLAGTMSGRWSTFKDTLTNFAATATSKLFEGMSSGLGDVQGLLDANQEKLTAVAEAIGSGLGAAFTWLTTTAIPALATAWQTLQPTLSLVAEAIGNVAQGVQNLMLVFQAEGLAGLFTVFEDGSSAIGSFLERLGLSEPMATAVSAALGQVVLAISGLVANAGPLFESLVGMISGNTAAFSTFGAILADIFGPQVGEIISTFATTWAERIGQIVSFAQQAFPLIQSIITSVLSIVGGFIRQHGDEILATLLEAWRTIQSAVSVAISAISQIVLTVLGAVATFIAAHKTEIQALLTQAWQTIQVVIQAAMAIIRNVIIPVLSAIAGFISAHKTEIVALLSGAWQIISNALSAALTLIRGIVTAAMQLLSGDWRGAWETIKQTLSSVLENLKGIVRGAIEVIKTNLRLGMEALAGIVRAVGPGLANAGRAIVDMLKSGISSAWEGLKSYFKGKLQELRNMLPFSEPKDSSSPLRGLVKTGATIISMIQEGIDSKTLGLKPGNVKVVEGFLDVMKNAGDAIGSAVAGLTKLQGYDAGALFEDVVYGFAEDVANVIAAMSESARQFSAKGLEAAGLFADSASKVLGLLGSGIDGLTKLQTYNADALFEDVVYGFAEDVARIVAAIAEVAQRFQAEALEHAGIFAEAATKVVGVIGAAVNAFKDLASFQDLPAFALQNLVGAISQAVIHMEEAAEGFNTDGLEHATVFAEAAGKILAPIKLALDSFTALRTYEGVASERMQALAADIFQAVWWMTEISQGAEATGLEAAAQFSEAVSKIFGAIKAATDVLGALVQYQAVPREVFAAFANDFIIAIGIVVQLADMGGVMLFKAREWERQMKDVEAALKSGTAALQSINGATEAMGHGAGTLPASQYHDIGKMALGGGYGVPNRVPGFALGVRGFGGGLAIVGERGPELVQLPRGSNVYSNRESQQMLAQPQRGGDTFIIHAEGSNRTEQEFMDLVNQVLDERARRADTYTRSR